MKKILRSLAMLSLLVLPLSLASRAEAQVAVGIGIGPEVGYPAPYAVEAAPVCEYGYYSYYPLRLCALRFLRA